MGRNRDNCRGRDRWQSPIFYLATDATVGKRRERDAYAVDGFQEQRCKVVVEHAHRLGVEEQAARADTEKKSAFGHVTDHGDLGVGHGGWWIGNLTVD